MSALIIYKSAPELFPIEQVSSQVYTPKWQPQDIRTGKRYTMSF